MALCFYSFCFKSWYKWYQSAIPFATFFSPSTLSFKIQSYFYMLVFFFPFNFCIVFHHMNKIKFILFLCKDGNKNLILFFRNNILQRYIHIFMNSVNLFLLSYYHVSDTLIFWRYSAWQNKHVLGHDKSVYVVGKGSSKYIHSIKTLINSWRNSERLKCRGYLLVVQESRTQDGWNLWWMKTRVYPISVIHCVFYT